MTRSLVGGFSFRHKIWLLMHKMCYGSVAALRRAFGTKFNVLVPPTQKSFQNVLDRFVVEGEIKRTKNGPKKTGAGRGIGGGGDTNKIDRVKQHFTEDPNCSLRDGSDLLGVRTSCA